MEDSDFEEDFDDGTDPDYTPQENEIEDENDESNEYEDPYPDNDTVPKSSKKGATQKEDANEDKKTLPKKTKKGGTKKEDANEDKKTLPKKTKKGGTKKATCPECLVEYSCVADHLRRKHGWTKDSSSKWRQLDETDEDRKPCPVTGCFLRLKQISVHLRKYHNLNTEERKILLKKKATPEGEEKDDYAKFQHYLASPTGGSRGKATAQMHGSFVSKIFGEFKGGWTEALKSDKHTSNMAVHVPGLVVILIFYIIIAVIGIVAGKKKNRKGTTEELFVANRNLGLFIASLTITAGLFFAPKARRAGYTTIIDPMQNKYGEKMGAMFFIPELCGNVFWIAATLTALGTTLSIVLGLNMVISIVVSAAIAVGYTFFGGLLSVAYTDVIQLFFMFIGLMLTIPFSISNPVVDLHKINDTWTGHVPTNMIGLYIDTWCMVCLGGVPWQAIYQRVLACATPEISRNAMLISAFLSLVLAIPPAVVGAVGKATDWNMTDFGGEVPLTYTQWTQIFPMVLHYVCPTVVSIIGIGAVSAAVMSSADSCVLATGSLFTHNIYRKLLRNKASEKELVVVLRVSMLVAGALGTVIATTVQSVYGLLILCADLMYVVQFPQFLCAMWIPFTNVYGSLAGYVLAFFLRIAGGEPYLRIPALLKFPRYDDTSGQLFPFKTFSMILSLILILLVSIFTNYLFDSLKIDRKFDVLKGYQSREKTQSSNRESVPLAVEQQVENENLNGCGNHVI